METQVTEEKKEESEFGAGLLYPIGLFMMHAERDRIPEESAKKIYGDDWENQNWSMWWYAAADHLFELQIPDALPEDLKQKARTLQHIAMMYRLPMEKKSDNKEKAHEALKLAKEILFGADKLIGVKPIKGSWE